MTSDSLTPGSFLSKGFGARSELKFQLCYFLAGWLWKVT